MCENVQFWRHIKEIKKILLKLSSFGGSPDSVSLTNFYDCNLCSFILITLSVPCTAIVHKLPCFHQSWKFNICYHWFKYEIHTTSNTY